MEFKPSYGFNPAVPPELTRSEAGDEHVCICVIKFFIIYFVILQVDQILVHQKLELLEVLLGCEMNNRYEIKNSVGQQIFSAVEQNDCCTRNFCGPSRSFTLRISDNNGQEVIQLAKPFRCTSCCCPCCQQEMEIQSPPGNPIGYVVQKWHPCLPKLSVLGASRELLLSIEGPVCVVSCCGDVDFQVIGSDGSVIGQISKQWSGLCKESLTDADNFGLTFPMDLDVKMKAVLLGACFLIDFMFFENVGDSGQTCSVFG
ncbi:phospholipid scramblase 1-like [Trichomycterus rosablanca]|uniref:phospholipid scramblase 1-like n=1 Tax=Trichomycterus rosablanca TaxID=2290929 RepID=UPI002F358A64